VFEASSSNRYATFFYGQYSPAEGRFDFVNAGHNPPMLCRRSDSDSTVVRLEPGGTVVGLLEDAQYVQGSVRLSPGDVLVLFTDGISEAMNLDDEEWGEDRLLQSIQTSRGASADELLKHLFEAATRFAGAAPQHDDMTLVVLRTFEA
jgi:phosphoserine phosphatase RsbU/P